MSKSWKSVAAAIVMVGGVSNVAIADQYEYDYEPVGKSFTPPPVFAWTGWYAGMNAGWIRLETESKRTGLTGTFGTPANAPFMPSKLSNDSDGFLAGLTLGYNQKMGAAFVGGIEADIAYTDIDSSKAQSITDGITTTGSTRIRTEMDWFGTVRARAGWLASQQMLLYVTGGLAYADIDHTGSVGIGPAVGPPIITGTGSSSNWKTGWTVGGGMEWLLGNKTTLKGEYLYYDLDDTSLRMTGPDFVGTASATYKNENTGHIVRMGLNVGLY